MDERTDETMLLGRPRCVLCRTCANARLRTGGVERRSPMRTCSAGLNAGPDVVQCESYVRAFLRVPAGGSRPRSGAPVPGIGS